MTQDHKEVEQLFPQGKDVTLKGKAYTVKPYGFGKFPKLLKLLNSITVPVDITDDQVKAMVKPERDNAALLKLVAENSDIVIDFCMMAINEKRDFFDDLPADEGFELCQALLEVNYDFFMRRLQPKLLAGMSSFLASVGGMSSQDSSQTATA